MVSGTEELTNQVVMPAAGDAYSALKFLADEVVDYNNVVAQTSGTHYITPILSDGTYYYVVRAVDDAGNESDAAVVKLQVSGAPQPIPALEYSSLPGPKIYLHWQRSPSSDAAVYNIYTNNGSGEIDYSTSIGQTSGSPWVWDEPLASGVWKFNVRAMDKDGFEETNFHNEITIEDVGSLGYPSPPTDPRAEAIEGGKIKVTWVSSISHDVKQYNIYSNNGEEKINYDNPIESVQSVESYIGRLRYRYISPPLQNGVTYKFGIRAENVAGSEEQNTDCVAMATADTLGPDKVSIEVSGMPGGREK